VSRISAAAPLTQAAFEGAANDTGDWFVGAYNDVSYFAGHNPGISMLGGLAVVSVTEPLAFICSKVDSQVQKFATRYQCLIVLRSGFINVNSLIYGFTVNHCFIDTNRFV
jgi:hypothetical protein